MVEQSGYPYQNFTEHGPQDPCPLRSVLLSSPGIIEHMDESYLGTGTNRPLLLLKVGITASELYVEQSCVTNAENILKSISFEDHLLVSSFEGRYNEVYRIPFTTPPYI